LNALNVSITAAYSFGDHGKTSVGIGVDRLSGYGNYSSDLTYMTDSFYNGHFENSNAQFARTRLTLGLTRQFSGGSKLGLYYRQGISSSDQESHYLQEYSDETHPGISSLTYGRTSISNLSSEIGARFRASLTRRLFYGVEGTYLYERVDSRRELLNRPSVPNHYHYLARRARLGGGLGFAPTSRILLNFDVTGGLFNNDRPAQAPGNSSGNFFSFSLSPGSLRAVQGTSVSAHAAVQTNLWRGLYLSGSSIRTVRGDLIYDPTLTSSFLYTNSDGFPVSESKVSYQPYKIKDVSQMSNFGLGWRFKPNFIAEYLYSMDHNYGGTRSHSLKIRYTFNLGITGEK